MRFLLDTNILIPLENSQVVLEESRAHFVRLANEHGHQLVYHPASEDDISRDTDLVRRGQITAQIFRHLRRHGMFGGGCESRSPAFEKSRGQRFSSKRLSPKS